MGDLIEFLTVLTISIKLGYLERRISFVKFVVLSKIVSSKHQSDNPNYCQKHFLFVTFHSAPQNTHSFG